MWKPHESGSLHILLRNLAQPLPSLVLLCLMVLTSLLTVWPATTKAALNQSHSPILIDGTGGFTEQNGVISGNGTASDPYIIEGWVIYSPEENAIDVRDTDAYFTIRNSIVSSDNPGHPTGCGLDNIVACQKGIFLFNVSNCMIENVEVSNNELGIVVDRSKNILIEGTIANLNSEGVDVADSMNITLANNTITTSFKAFEIENSMDIVINENRFSLENRNDNQDSGLLNSTNAVFSDNTGEIIGMEVISSEKIMISTNNLYLHYPLRISDSLGLTVLGNHFLGSLDLSRSVNVTVSANYLVSGGIDIDDFGSYDISPDNLVNGLPLYYYKDCSGVRVEDVQAGQVVIINCDNIRIANVRIGNTSEGIEMFRVRDTLVANSTFSGNFCGICFSTSKNVTIAGDTVSNNFLGIEDTNSTNLLISRNNVSNNTPWGMYLWGSSQGTILGNNISGNQEGIRFTVSSAITIEGNTITSNKFGILVDPAQRRLVGHSHNLSFYHNNFLANLAIDYGMNDMWDSGYPGGGNFWSDSLFVDNCSGSTQNICPDPDGIGDTPKLVARTSVDHFDHYPLMKPFAPPVVVTAKYAPNVISLSSVSKYLTVSIQLPIGLSVSNVVLSSIRLNGTIGLAAGSRATVVSLNGAQVLIVRFNIADVKTLFTKLGGYRLFLTGNIVDSFAFRPFESATVIRVRSGDATLIVS